MVVETKFRVSRYAQDTPLSLGSPAGTTTSIYLPGAPLPWQQGIGRPGITFGIPGTGGYEEYPVTDPNPGSCRTGFTRNYLGQCVPIQQLPECPTGFARDSQGNCVQIPVTPVPPTPGMSAQIVKIQLPRSFIQGRTVTIRTWFQNYRADAPLYAIKLNLPGISFTHTTPPVPSNTVGQTVRIDSTFTVPNFAQIAIHPPPPIPGTVALQRYQQVQCVTTPCNPQLVETPDTENINLYTTVAPPVVTPPIVTPPPPTPTPVPPRPRPPVSTCTTIHKQCVLDAIAGRGSVATCNNNLRACILRGIPGTGTGTTTPPSGPATITIAPTTVTRRGNFVISGAGFTPRELVNIEIRAGNSISRTAQIANSSGQIRKTVRAANVAGVSTVTLRGRSSNRGAQGTVTVT